MNIILTSVITWFLFIPIAIANGIVRERLYKSIVGDLTGHQISTVSASALFILLTYLMLGSKVPDLSNEKLLLIGLMWVIMTIIFEFGFGHYVDGASWEKLLTDYNIFKGHVWGVFLLVVLLSPIIVKWIRS